MKINIDNIIIICEDRAVMKVVKAVFGHDVLVLKNGSNVAGISAKVLEKKSFNVQMIDKEIVILVGDATKHSLKELEELNSKNKYLRNQKVYNVVLNPEVEKILLYHYENNENINKITSQKNNKGKFDPKKYCELKGYSFDNLTDKEIYNALEKYYSKNNNEYHNLLEVHNKMNK